MSTAWYPLKWSDWFMSEDDKKDIEKQWINESGSK